METKERQINALRTFFANNENVTETNYADNSLINISFQSLCYKNRHVWIGYYRGRYFIDLEDWNDETRFDNTVASFDSKDMNIVCEILAQWFNGTLLDNISFQECNVSYFMGSFNRK